jgi:putative hydrolase
MLASAIVEAAEARNLAAIAITDHGPELSVGISPSRIEPMITDVEIAREDAGIPVLCGIEANVVDSSGTIDINERLLDRFDLLVVGVHRLSWAIRDRAELARAYLTSIMNAMERQRVDVVAHPFRFHGNLADYLTPEDIDAFVELAARQNVAIEVNSRYHAPDENLLKACLRKGVKLSVGTDAHTPAEVGSVDWPMAMLRRLGAREEDLILRRFL